MRKLSLLAVVLLLTACGSGGLGDLGGILGSPSSTQPSDVQGTVNYVDTQNQRIDPHAYPAAPEISPGR